MSADPRPVKLLLDENLSPWAAAQLRSAGVDAVHVRERGLLGASDPAVLQRAYEEDRLLVTSNIGDFVKLFEEQPEGALFAAKVPFVTSSGHTEYLWSEVREMLDDEQVSVFLETPPVTHTGPVERAAMYKQEDLVDWHVTLEDGSIHGNYTQRALYEIARRDGIKLPRKMLELESYFQ